MTDLVCGADANGVATLTLNRPDKLNALTVDLFRALDAHVRDIQHHPVAVVVLRGRAVFRPATISATSRPGEKPPEPHFQSKVIERLADLPPPVVSAVHGHCYTGALELALAADIVLASANAKFADTHAKWALTPIWGLSQRLPRRIGTYKAREMMFTCRTYSGAEAAAMASPMSASRTRDFEMALADLAAGIAANSLFSHAANKRLLRRATGCCSPRASCARSIVARGAAPTWRRGSPPSPPAAG